MYFLTKRICDFSEYPGIFKTLSYDFLDIPRLDYVGITTILFTQCHLGVDVFL